MRLTLFTTLLLSAAYSITANEETFLSRTRQLTFDGERAGEGYFDSAGTKLVFQSEREADNPFYQIFVLDLESGETKRISPGSGKTTCAFIQPKTNEVMFASTHLDPKSEALQMEEFEIRAKGDERRYAWDYDPHFDIFVTDADGGNPKQLTHAWGYDAEGAYSPDGQQIVFCSNRHAYPLEALSPDDQKRAELNSSYFGEIYIMNADGSNQRRLTDASGYDGGPFFSPDGERIIWRRFDEHGVIADIFSMKTDGTDVRQLTDFNCMSWAPYFHPSGEYAIFGSNKFGFANFELFIVDAEGKKEPVRITTTEGFDGLPVFHPKGEMLAWTSQRHGKKGGQLYLSGWDHEAARKALAAAPDRGTGPLSENQVNGDESTPDTPDQTPQLVRSPKELGHKFSEKITEEDIEVQLAYLASEAMGGRLTGTDGERLASEFIAERFEEIGLKSLPVVDGYFQSFDFTAGVRAGEENRLSLFPAVANPHMTLADRRAGAKGEVLIFDKKEDFSPLAFSDSGTTAGLLAFAGYGLVVPNDAGEEPIYDSYGDLDVEGRIVVVFRYVPEGISAEQRQQFNRYAGLRYKALLARERGAAGIIVVTGPNSPSAGEVVSMDLDMGGATSGIFAVSVSGEVADQLMKSSEKSLKELQTVLDPGEEIINFNLEAAGVELRTELLKEKREGRNVIGYLPPTSGIATDSEFVVIGAHYDHLGRSEESRSLARKGEEGMIHYGADDNASGIAAMLEIAECIASSEITRQRGVVFAAWSGEELGLLGSAYFTRHRDFKPEEIVAYLNMDMVGRLKENKLTIQGVGSSGDWRGMIEKRNVLAGFALSLGEDPYLPTDSMSFYVKEIPGLQFFTGAHEDYHRPTDTADKVNYEGTTRVAEFVEAIARPLIEGNERPVYAKVLRAKQEGGSRDSMRAYLGTIPDYANEGIVGVLLSGVSAGGPADKAGVQGGDIIVKFAGQEIKNIYDFTYALDAVKIGEAVAVTVQRNGKAVELEIIPEARN